MIDRRDNRPFAVFCVRSDGATPREFNRFTDRAEAERFAAALVRVGLPARVDTPTVSAPPMKVPTR